MAQLPAQIYSHNQTAMNQYPHLMESPDVQNRNYVLPNSEQPPSLNHSRVDRNHE